MSDWLWRAWGTAAGLPLFEEYILHADRLVVRRGVLIRREDETPLYRVMDTTLQVSLLERLLGLGTVVIRSADPTDPAVALRGIRDARRVRDMIRDAAEEVRDQLGIPAREMWGAAGSATGR